MYDLFVFENWAAIVTENDMILCYGSSRVIMDLYALLMSRE